jgi:ribosomal protein S18 acetylase RimI-like enzyme
MREVTVGIASGDAAEDEAATIWARATARRDGTGVRDVAETLPAVRRRLALPGATLLLARRNGEAVGFAVVVPRTSALEVYFLAVDPGAWSSGVGSRLLRAVDDHARSTGHRRLELWVIADNARAIATYERAGWARTDETQLTDQGRTELRLVRIVAPDRV